VPYSGAFSEEYQEFFFTWGLTLLSR